MSEKPKTAAQRNAFHLWCGQLAEQLNDAGLDQKVVFDEMKKGVDIPWTKRNCERKLMEACSKSSSQKGFY